MSNIKINLPPPPGSAGPSSGPYTPPAPPPPQSGMAPTIRKAPPSPHPQGGISLAGFAPGASLSGAVPAAAPVLSVGNVDTFSSGNPAAATPPPALDLGPGLAAASAPAAQPSPTPTTSPTSPPSQRMLGLALVAAAGGLLLVGLLLKPSPKTSVVVAPAPAA